MLRYTSIRSDFRFPRLILGLLTMGFALLSMACGTEAPSSDNTSVRAPFGSLSPEELKAMIDQSEIFNLVDIRSVQEYIAGHLPGAISIPYRQLPNRYRQLDPRTSTVIYCQTGLYSILAAQMLAGLEFSDLYDLSGGFNGWEYAVELSSRRQVL